MKKYLTPQFTVTCFDELNSILSVSPLDETYNPVIEDVYDSFFEIE